MTEAAGPTPKRKRTDNTSVTISPEQIIQTNATVEHFTGQRHNRWMQGYTPNSEQRGDTNAPSRLSTQPAHNGAGTGARTSVDARSKPENMRSRSTSNMHVNGLAAHANWQLPAGLEGATQAPSALPAGRASIVNYESPSTSNLSTSTNGGTSMDGNVMNPNPNPGLPSPAPTNSDDNASSPVTGGSTMPANMLNPMQQAPNRGGPRGQLPTPTVPSNSHAMPLPATASQQPSQAPHGRGMQYGNTRAHNNASAGPSAHQRMLSQQPPAQPVASSSTAPQGVGVADPYAPNALMARINAFHQPPGLDGRTAEFNGGRLTLLREAVTGQIDWFYLALSHVHALAQLQSPDLPQVIRSLPPNCWKYLEDLVCSNAKISPNLLGWLAAFPASIITINSDHAMSAHYNTHINTVAKFLHELPAKWDALVARCQQMQAPPLTQDLGLDLELRSSVLQTVAFRAVTRMIYQISGNDDILTHLEVLHRWDKQAYYSRSVRQPAEKNNAYWAFQRVHGAYAQWQLEKQNHDVTQQRVPHFSRTNYQQFALSQYCPEVFDVFHQPRPASAAPAPNIPHLAQQQRGAVQQQQARQLQMMLADQQRRAQMQASNQVQVNPHPPTSAAMQYPSSPAAMQYPPVMQYPSSPAATQYPSTSAGMQYPPAMQYPQVSAAMQYRQQASRAIAASPMPVQQQAPNLRLVFPHETAGPRSQPTEPNSNRSALQQAHLRSPVSVPLQIGKVKPQLYRFVRKYALSPTRLNKDIVMRYISLDIPQDDIANIPNTVASQTAGEPPSRLFLETSQTFRLRCCAMPPNGFRTESEWVLADTVWPDTLYLEFNGNMLEMRRALHHKKNLPIDLTHLVRAGENRITVSIMRTSFDTSPFNFAIAVEVVGTIAHSTLVGKLEHEQSVSAATTLSSIQKTLAGNSGGAGIDDDDVAITSTSVTVNLFDPFSGSIIFSTPVRGLGCRHTECFDLETFLSQCKRDQPGAPTIPDCWRCPLCRGDVRPNMMVRDEWLAGVREELEMRGELGIRAIEVEADGSWKVKMEGGEKEGAGYKGKGKGKMEEMGEGTPVPKKKKVTEVIELD